MSAVISVDRVLMKRNHEIKPFVVLSINGQTFALSPDVTAAMRAELEKAEAELAIAYAGAVAAPDLVTARPVGAA